jgi:hypothetical protein
LRGTLGVKSTSRGTFVELLHLIIKELQENLELAWNFEFWRGTFRFDNQGVTKKFGTLGNMKIKKSKKN